jgi:hypothetical protein
VEETRIEVLSKESQSEDQSLLPEEVVLKEDLEEEVATV